MAYTTAVGIDVSKKTLDVTILTNGSSFHKKVSNSKQGITSIRKFLRMLYGAMNNGTTFSTKFA